MSTEKAKERSSYRTAKDQERLQRAAELVARRQTAFDEAKAALAAAEAAFFDDPSDKHATKAKEARRALEDAMRDLELARAHATKVERDVAAAEREAILKEIARREAILTEIVDEEARERAVELAVLAVALRRRTVERAEQRRAEIAELNELRRRVGAPVEDVRALDSLVADAVEQMAELGLAAQAQLGVRVGLTGRAARYMPYWSAAGPWEIGPKEFMTGDEHVGRDGKPIVFEAKRLLERVAKRRAAAEPRVGVASLGKAAAVVAAGVAAAFTIIGG